MVHLVHSGLQSLAGRHALLCPGWLGCQRVNTWVAGGRVPYTGAICIRREGKFPGCPRPVKDWAGVCCYWASRLRSEAEILLLYAIHGAVVISANVVSTSKGLVRPSVCLSVNPSQLIMDAWGDVHKRRADSLVIIDFHAEDASCVLIHIDQAIDIDRYLSIFVHCWWPIDVGIMSTCWQTDKFYGT